MKRLYAQVLFGRAQAEKGNTILVYNRHILL